jgi:hypothetical protein
MEWTPAEVGPTRSALATPYERHAPIQMPLELGGGNHASEVPGRTTACQLAPLSSTLVLPEETQSAYTKSEVCICHSLHTHSYSEGGSMAAG